MRRWELVEGGSAKFWEVDRNGTAVTVRYGRLGAEGQAKEKSFDTGDAAEAHVAKLVREKEKKGYREVTGRLPGAESSVEAAGGLPDEDSFALPRSWWAGVHPRRGGVVRWDAAPKPEAVGTVRAALAALPPKSRAALEERDSERELVDAALAHLAGAATPLGAGVVARLLVSEGIPMTPVVEAFADAWVVEHGLPFAARAVVELCRVELHWTSAGLRETPRVLRFQVPHTGRYPDSVSGGVVGARVRELIAAAERVEDVEQALEEYLADPVARFAVAYLVPHRRDWVDRVCEDVTARGHAHDWLRLLHSIGGPGQLRHVVEQDWASWRLGRDRTLHSVLDGVGPAAAPALATLFDRDPRSDLRKLLLDAFVRLPTDEAFALLLARVAEKGVQPAVQEMARRFPVRALRLLSEASGPAARLLLKAHLQRHPGLPEQVELSPVGRAAVEELRAAAADRLDDAVDGLPELLVRPPWTVERAPVEPVVVTGLAASAHRAVEWAPGEREAWVAAGLPRHLPDMPGGWSSAARAFEEGKLPWHTQARFFLHGPEELVTPLVDAWRPPQSWDAEQLAKALVVRFGERAIGPVLHIASFHPASAGPLLGPLVSTEVAERVADWASRLKSARAGAVAWVRRHPAHAARFLLPAAVGPAGPVRRAAEAVLRLVPDQAREAAREHGPEAERAVERVLAVDPFAVLPAKVPVPGDWADPALLPQVVVRGTGRALPAESVGHVLTMVALSTPDEPYQGVEVVRELCEPASLAAFGRELFRLWQAAGMPSKDSWAMTAQGLFGDDETVRVLTPLIRAWPGESQHQRAVAGLDVLAAIGTDLALVSLNGIAQKAKFKGLKQRAQEKIASVAAALDLAPEQLADRLVPDFGLDEAATLVVDYGPRRFTVGFDEQLKPYVLDEDGKRRKDLPKPGAKDDPERAAAEHKRFGALKKDVRSVAADQIARLELAMVLGRRWSAAEFRTLLAGHPLLWHIVRRLVWVTDGGASFRVAEDRTPADVADDAFELPDDARVGVAHPLHLGDDLAAWSEVFADYEILQPFPQLGRPVHALDAAERRAAKLERFEGSVVPVGRLLGLTKRGWERGQPQDAGVECWITRPLADGGSVVVNLDPGIAVGIPHEFPEQKLTDIWVTDASGPGWRPRGGRTFGELDPVTASEVLAEFTALTS
ncbi:DUF4132 domain-containing protein [Saccharothrix longispora]|uniref:DNA-binding WGR domain protein n=1 Tax=Saccharothrix longispora TaxID=33920 RepID=A0ABU1PPB5_9PSEU|nr:DUF4132 domain-containing protein [Saccharothrix longispora]MDR6592296.1 putative DNA-binding WGR domain protein [Saccharothrix longispora]